jgi:hypothetical protein
VFGESKISGEAPELLRADVAMRNETPSANSLPESNAAIGESSELRFLKCKFK